MKSFLCILVCVTSCLLSTASHPVDKFGSIRQGANEFNVFHRTSNTAELPVRRQPSFILTSTNVLTRSRSHRDDTVKDRRRERRSPSFEAVEQPPVLTASLVDEGSGDEPAASVRSSVEGLDDGRSAISSRPTTTTPGRVVSRPIELLTADNELTVFTDQSMTHVDVIRLDSSTNRQTSEELEPARCGEENSDEGQRVQKSSGCLKPTTTSSFNVPSTPIQSRHHTPEHHSDNGGDGDEQGTATSKTTAHDILRNDSPGGAPNGGARSVTSHHGQVDSIVSNTEETAAASTVIESSAMTGQWPVIISVILGVVVLAAVVVVVSRMIINKRSLKTAQVNNIGSSDSEDQRNEAL